jgi:tetratricopeptide (TPR) repeat protein
MDTKEKLLGLIQKEEESALSSVEMTEMKSLLGNPECLEFYNTYKIVQHAFSKKEHLNYETLSDYILLKNGLEPEDSNIILKLPKVEYHLRECNTCLDEFNMLNSELNEIESFLSKPAEKTLKDKLTPAARRRTLSVRYGIIAGLTIGIIYFAAMVISKAVTPDNIEYAQITNEPDFYTTRGRMTDQFQASLEALENKQYPIAIKHLELDIKNNSGDAALFYSYYILGLAYLETAENNILGLFPSYDKPAVEKGLKNLDIAINLNNTGRFTNVALDAYFYKAKALLMLGKNKEAKKNLQYVLTNRGSKLGEAQDILKQME